MLVDVTERIVVVDGLEVGAKPGVVTLRGGEVSDEPVVIALPVQVASALLGPLSEAARAAEERFWSVLRRVIVKAGSPTDADGCHAAMREWLESRAWHKILGGVPPKARTIGFSSSRIGGTSDCVCARRSRRSRLSWSPTRHSCSALRPASALPLLRPTLTSQW